MKRKISINIQYTYMYLHKYVFTQVSIIISFNVAVCTCKSKIGSPPHHGAGAVGDARKGHHGQHVALILGQWSDIAEEEDYKMHKNKDIWMKLNSFEISIRRVLIQKEWGKEYHLKECIKTDVKTLPAKTFPFFDLHSSAHSCFTIFMKFTFIFLSY